MAKRKVTLSLENKTYLDFQKYCEKNGLLMSRNIDLYIERVLAEAKKTKKVIM